MKLIISEELRKVHDGLFQMKKRSTYVSSFFQQGIPIEYFFGAFIRFGKLCSREWESMVKVTVNHYSH